MLDHQGLSRPWNGSRISTGAACRHRSGSTPATPSPRASPCSKAEALPAQPLLQPQILFQSPIGPLDHPPPLGSLPLLALLMPPTPSLSLPAGLHSTAPPGVETDHRLSPQELVDQAIDPLSIIAGIGHDLLEQPSAPALGEERPQPKQQRGDTGHLTLLRRREVDPQDDPPAVDHQMEFPAEEGLFFGDVALAPTRVKAGIGRQIGQVEDDPAQVTGTAEDRLFTQVAEDPVQIKAPRAAGPQSSSEGALPGAPPPGGGRGYCTRPAVCDPRCAGSS